MTFYYLVNYYPYTFLNTFTIKLNYDIYIYIYIYINIKYSSTLYKIYI